MKLRTVLISVVVTAALVGGAGYGAYYVTQNQKSPVEVVPVANVSQGYYGMDQQETIYGSITSQVAQTVRLDDDYGVEKVYVKQGDTVKEGTPLLSYDMTLQELELEMQQLELQTNKLTMTRLEKELDKLKKTPATASLKRDWFTLTASADETEPAAGQVPETTAETETEPVTEELVTEENETSEDGTSAGDPAGSGEFSDEFEDSGVTIEGVEEVDAVDDDEPATLADGVLSFKGLVLAIETTFLSCGDDLSAENVGEAIEQAVLYYRKHLADEQVSEETLADGTTREVRSYTLKDTVKEAIAQEESTSEGSEDLENQQNLEELEELCTKLDEYQVQYVEMLIYEASVLEDDSALPGAVAQIRAAYDLLATAQQDEVENTELMEQLAEKAETLPPQDETDAGETDPGQPQEEPSGEDGLGDLETQTVESGESDTPEGGTDEGETSDAPQTPEGSEGGEDGQDVRLNTVVFDVADGAMTTVDGQDVTNSMAMAQDGKIVFRIDLEDGYNITDVLVDGSIPARKNEASEEPDDYIIEGIQTNDTIVTVGTQLAAPAETETPESQSETSETQSETPAGQNTGTPEKTELPQTDTYTVTINPGGQTKQYKKGDLVPLNADLKDVTLAFIGWSVEPAKQEGQQTEQEGQQTETASEQESQQTETGTEPAGQQTETGSGQTTLQAAAAPEQTETESEETESEETERKIDLLDEDIDQGYASFLMPAYDVIATARYQDAPDAINSYTDTFLGNAEKLLASDGEQVCTEEGKDYVTEIEGVITFYQQWLSRVPEEFLDEAAQSTGPEMEKYQLLENVVNYLTDEGKSERVALLTENYKELCMLYVKTMFLKLNQAALDKTLLEKALIAYNRLGENWRYELELRWEDEQAALAEQAGTPWKVSKKGNRKKPKDFLSIGETLAAYAVIQMFQDYLALPPETPEQDRYIKLTEIWGKYLELNDAQKALVSATPLFVDTMKQSGLWTDEEPETEFSDDYGDYDDYDEDEIYTAEELKEMIRDKENEIKSCALDIRQSELDLKQKQRVVDGKVVKSTMDGTVVSMGGSTEETEDDYFLKISNETGLYVKGMMSELSLEKIHVGDTISGMSSMTGANFTAVVKEISEYPEDYTDYYGQGNTNASHYPFYALIENTEGLDLEEGDAEIYLTATVPSMDGIYLENYFIRSEADGRSYVYKKGEDGTLTKQYVTTGKSMYGYALEIKDGLESTDSIAFPYGKDVKEGAKTTDVDRLEM